MKFKLKLLCIIASFAVNAAYAQSWNWSARAGGDASQSYDSGHSITDGINSYLYGTFSGNMFLQTDTFYSNGQSDIFIIKYDNSGNEIWSKAFSAFNGPNQAEWINMVYDSINNCIYFSGKFWGSLYVDSYIINGGLYNNSFIGRMELSGNISWIKLAYEKNSFFVPGVDDIPIIYVNSNGIPILISYSSDTADFDNITLMPGGCMAKYDEQGNCFYARNLFGNMSNSFNFLRIKDLGNDMLFYGCFLDSMNLDTASMIAVGGYDTFIAKADSNGNLVWIKHFGNPSDEFMTHADIDNAGNIYIVGGFTDSTVISGNSFYNTTDEILVTKFDNSGNLIWGSQAFATGNIISGSRIDCENDGSCYVAGVFSGSITFDSYQASTTHLFDAFLTRFNSSGDCLGLLNFGKARANSVHVDNSGSPIIAGNFANTVTIGPNTFSSYGPFDIYLAKAEVFTGTSEGKIINNELIIFANPNSGKCNITIPEEFLNQKELQLRIYDIAGKLIQQQKLDMNDGEIKLNLEEEAKGTYTAVLSNSSKSYTGKIIFE